MIPEGLDKSISTAIAISSATLAFWAHRRELASSKARAFEAAKQQYSEAQLKEYAAQRDFGHIKRDLEQLKANIAHLNNDSDARLDHLERQMEKLTGSLQVVINLVKKRDREG